MRRTLLPLVLVLLGCKRPAPEGATPAAAPSATGPAEAPAPAAPPEAPKAQEPESDPPVAVAPLAEPPPPPTDPERRALESAFVARTCLLKRQDRTGNAEVDKQHGFADAADFAMRWSTAAAADGVWAETVMAKALATDCSPPPAPP